MKTTLGGAALALAPGLGGAAIAQAHVRAEAPAAAQRAGMGRPVGQADLVQRRMELCVTPASPSAPASE